MPSGTWYDYLGGAVKATATTCVLAPGELKVFTGTQVELPAVPDCYTQVPIENVWADQDINAQKILRNGQILILRGDKVYTITGQMVK